MSFTLSRAFVEKFPFANIGCVVANISSISSDVSSEVVDLIAHGVAHLDGKPLGEAPWITIWRETFKNFGLNSTQRKECRSSLEALTDRAKKGKFPTILPVIDLYNAFSVASGYPMGGYDLSKIEGNISLSFGDGSTFSGLHMDPIKTESQHVIYRDESSPLCWLWNYRDAEHSCITRETQTAIFFIDMSDSRVRYPMSIEDAVKGFSESLTRHGAEIIQTGIVNASTPTLSLADTPLHPIGSSFKVKELLPLSESERKLVLENPSLFIHYVSTGDYQRVECLLTGHPDPQSLLLRGSPSGNIFHYIARSGDCHILSLVASHLTVDNIGSLLSEKNNAGDTPLETARRHNLTSMIKSLEGLIRPSSAIIFRPSSLPHPEEKGRAGAGGPGHSTLAQEGSSADVI